MALAEQERAHWSSYIAQWKASGQTSKAFCHEHGVEHKVFNQWRKKLWSEHKAQEGNKIRVPHFIPVIKAPVNGTEIKPIEIKLELREGVKVSWQIGGFVELAQQLHEMALL